MQREQLRAQLWANYRKTRFLNALSLDPCFHNQSEAHLMVSNVLLSFLREFSSFLRSFFTPTDSRLRGVIIEMK